MGVGAAARKRRRHGRFVECNLRLGVYSASKDGVGTNDDVGVGQDDAEEGGADTTAVVGNQCCGPPTVFDRS